MNSLSIDILVPVWNNPFETRACLAAILATSCGSRLIIVDNGSSRETELMLEEFSESLGERGLFIKSERNIGLVAAINLGLARSDGDYTVILRPHVTVHAGWLDALTGTAEHTSAGIVSPLFSGPGEVEIPVPAAGCSVIESGVVSFSTLLLRTAMFKSAGVFDDRLDGGEWCLKEYVRRVASYGYRTVVDCRVNLACSAAQQFGSVQRRQEMRVNSQASYISAWGISRHYCIYFGKEAAGLSPGDVVTAILDGARQGHRFTLLLHRRQYADFRKMGWNSLHTGINVHRVSLLLAGRDIRRRLKLLRNSSPDLIAVCGCGGVAFPGVDTAISLEDLLVGIRAHTTNIDEKNGGGRSESGNNVSICSTS